MLGGRTNHWGRVSLRNGPYDFKPRSRDGLGFDWPISYEEFEPYYTKVEMLVGVHGTNEGRENTPDSPPGVLLPPVKARTHELMLKKHGKKFGFPMIPIHRAVLTRKLDVDSIPAKLHPNNPRAQKLTADAIRARAACFYATPCGRGCSIGAQIPAMENLPPHNVSWIEEGGPQAVLRTRWVGWAWDGRGTESSQASRRPEGRKPSGKGLALRAPSEQA